METLLDQADALVLSAGEEGPEKPPNFELPEELVQFTKPNPNKLEIRDTRHKGCGWFTKKDIPAGEIVLVSKPLVCTLDLECIDSDDDDDEIDVDVDVDVNGNTAEQDDDEPYDSRANELLVVDVLQRIIDVPSIWSEQLTNLYPRESTDIESSPVWISKDDTVLSQFEAMIDGIERNVAELKGKSKEISRRLPLIIRYNVLSIETCPELLSHPGINGHHKLSGVGLYYYPSFFNHDHHPNIARYSVGDVMWFVTNQHIIAGNELCISYLEQDVLCENSHRRNAMLTLDFKEEDDDRSIVMDSDDDNEPRFPVVDADVQNELMTMNPFERLDAIDELMEQALGKGVTEHNKDDKELIDDKDQNMEESSGSNSTWFECDIQNLRILKAITLESSGQSESALRIWDDCITFTENKMPPNDENSIVMRVQAAICSLHLKQKEIARRHASIALQRHDLIFGGGVIRFRRRYRNELRLNLRKSTEGKNNDERFEDMLWPYES